MNTIQWGKFAAFAIRVDGMFKRAYATGENIDRELAAMQAAYPIPDEPTKYVIGKATRYRNMDVVRRHPRVISNRPITDRHDELRRGVYDTLREAQEAAIEAKERNPVGFVVLIYEPREGGA